MLDIVKMKPVIDIHDLIDAMGEIEGVEHHKIFRAFKDMHCYGGGNESYLEIGDDWIVDDFLKSVSKRLGKEYEDISDEELVSYSSPEDSYDKVRLRLFEMMVKEEIPREFVVHLWW